MYSVFLFYTRPGCVSQPLQSISFRRQSTVHPTETPSTTCSSQDKVAACLHSSEDMERCSEGESLELPHDLQLSRDSALCDILMYNS